MEPISVTYTHIGEQLEEDKGSVELALKEIRDNQVFRKVEDLQQLENDAESQLRILKRSISVWGEFRGMWAEKFRGWYWDADDDREWKPDFGTTYQHCRTDERRTKGVPRIQNDAEGAKGGEGLRRDMGKLVGANAEYVEGDGLYTTHLLSDEKGGKQLCIFWGDNLVENERRGYRRRSHNISSRYKDHYEGPVLDIYSSNFPKTAEKAQRACDSVMKAQSAKKRKIDEVEKE